MVDDIERVLSPHRPLTSFPAVLDFGCGCGRVLTAMSARLRAGQRLFGTDIDSEAIAWCHANYAELGEFAHSQKLPPTPYRDGQFDLVYGISVFTHLPESMQFDWLRELARITAPGGYLVLSVHGRSHLPRLSSAHQAEVETKGFCYVDLGTTDGLPDYYLTTYHSERYIRERWSEVVDVLALCETAVGGWQDAVVCRRRPASRREFSDCDPTAATETRPLSTADAARGDLASQLIAQRTEALRERDDALGRLMAAQQELERIRAAYLELRTYADAAGFRLVERVSVGLRPHPRIYRLLQTLIRKAAPR